MLRTVMAVLLGLTLTAAAWAQESGGEHARYAEGTHYKVLDNPGNVDEPGQVEVREFFSYICPHCFSLEPVIEDWLEDKPEHVNYVRSPVTFLQLFLILVTLAKIDAFAQHVLRLPQKW